MDSRLRGNDGERGAGMTGGTDVARPAGFRLGAGSRWRGDAGVTAGVEATGGFEPPNRGFADPRLRPLGYVASECVVPRMRLELIQP